MHRTLDRPVPKCRVHPPSPDGDGLALAWFESMASLAWLLERRQAMLSDAGGRAYLECLRLRAIVALMWWERLLPQALSCWSMSDAERLVAEVAAAERIGDVKAMAVGECERGLASLLVRGPARAVLDWIEAAGIRRGPVFRRISPDGRVKVGALTPVGVASLFSILLMEGRSMGVIDRQFSLDFSKRSPAFSRLRTGYLPAGRDEVLEDSVRLVASGGREPPRHGQRDVASEDDHACL